MKLCETAEEYGLKDELKNVLNILFSLLLDIKLYTTGYVENVPLMLISHKKLSQHPVDDLFMVWELRILSSRIPHTVKTMTKMMHFLNKTPTRKELKCVSPYHDAYHAQINAKLGHKVLEALTKNTDCGSYTPQDTCNPAYLRDPIHVTWNTSLETALFKLGDLILTENLI